MEALVFAVAGEVFSPGGEDEERAGSAGLKARLLGLPVFADGLGLQVNQAQAARKAFVLDALLALADAGRYEDIALVGRKHQPLAFPLPEERFLCSDHPRFPLFRHLAVEEDLRLLRMPQQQEIAESAVAHAVNYQAEGPLHQLGPELAHEQAPGVVVEVGPPALQLAVAHEYAVIIARLEERLFFAILPLFGRRQPAG